MRRVILAVSAAALGLGGCELSVGGSNETGDAAADSAAATGKTRFVNSRANARSAQLREHYADFSFDYPANWRVAPQRSDAGAQNYVRVAAPLIQGYEPFAFHVGFASGDGDAERDRAMIESGTPQLAEQFGGTFQNYRVVSVGPERVGGQDSYGWRFTATAPAVDGGAPVQVYGRADIVLPPGATSGVFIISLATSRTAEVRSAAEVGEVGTLKGVLDSFRLGVAQPVN